MSRFQHKNDVRNPGLLVVILTCVFFLFPYSAGAQHPSGMSLKLYLMEDRLEYNMSASSGIGLIGVIKNETEWPVNTNAGIKEIELEQYLIATDPYGVRHVAVGEAQAAEDMPPSSTWGDLDTVPAELIQPGYERSVQIVDLRNLFPAMKRTPGEWKIQASITISRFLYTVSTQDGVRGVDDRAWHGSLVSNQLRIFVVPDYGARLKVRVEDLSQPDIKTQSQVPVRVYKGSDIEAKNYTLADAWQKLTPLARGMTDQGGWVTLPPGASCLPRPDAGDSYVAIAEYKGKYNEAIFEEDTEGWNIKCGGRLERYIFFEEPVEEPRRFSVFGLNSVWLQNRVRVESGDIGAQAECTTCIVPNFEVALDDGVWIGDGSTIKGDSVYVAATASVWDVACNELSGSGRVRGDVTMPLDIPVWEALIDAFPSEFNPAINKSSNINVSPHRIKTLVPGENRYHDITIRSHAKLILDPGDDDPGIFHFNNLSMHSHASLICLGPSEIRVKGQIISVGAKSSYLGPAERSGLGAKDVVIYVAGSSPAIILGQGNRIRASLFAKNGSLISGEGCMLVGSFIARDVRIGQKSIVRYDVMPSSEPYPKRINRRRSMHKRHTPKRINRRWSMP